MTKESRFHSQGKNNEIKKWEQKNGEENMNYYIFISLVLFDEHDAFATEDCLLLRYCDIYDFLD